jgi:hypothetical protein
MPFYYSPKTFTAGREGGRVMLPWICGTQKKPGNMSDASKRNTFTPPPVI